MWGKNATGNAVSGVRHLEHEEQAVHPLPKPRGYVHRTANAGRLGALPAGELEAWQVRTTDMNRLRAVQDGSLQA
jgi:hypothetical protein